MKAGETLDLYANVSTDPAADNNKFFVLWVLEDGEGKAVSYDDSWTHATAENSTNEDNGGIALSYKTTVQKDTKFEV